MRRISIILSAAAAWVLALAVPASAHDPVIPVGARVAGYDVGGLRLSAAAEELEAMFGGRLRAPVRVRAAGHRRKLTASRARLRFDPLRSARRANIAARHAQPGSIADVDPWVGYDADRVAAFVDEVAGTLARQPRNARLRFAVTKLKIASGRDGYDIDRDGVSERIEQALEHPDEPRILRAKRVTIHPAVGRRDLRDRDRTVVTIHRRGFRLRVFKGLHRVASYPVAVGMPGHATPRGRFRITSKAVDPAWSAPDKPWAGAYRDEVVPGGRADNPLKARWLGIEDGVGIHGTGATWSLGRRASHGCIRMAVPAVKRVYRLVPLGAPVMIK